ncbi:MAG TPA: helix-turn-helix domain-containing protein [bacterium]|nr:helix-turn-helix domain-containing protein [bacterium]HPP29789.1 helix-turn-helix domain-containing protein [bacterium]
MRRTEKELKKLRLRIIELRKSGYDYEDIRRKTGASPNTISKILKNFKGRYCQKCGETNSEVLEEHHPDKENQPDYTITLCANCHEEITRRQLRERNKKKNENLTIQTLPQVPIVSQNIDEIKQPNIPALLPPAQLNPEDVKVACFSIGGIGCLAELTNPERKPLEKFLLVVAGGICFWATYEILKNRQK